MSGVNIKYGIVRTSVGHAEVETTEVMSAQCRYIKERKEKKHALMASMHVSYNKNKNRIALKPFHSWSGRSDYQCPSILTDSERNWPAAEYTLG
jgi:hypothetical protein